MTLSSRLSKGIIAQVNARLESFCVSDDQTELSEAVGAALLAPGKRLRPLLTVLIASAEETAIPAAIDVGCACEMLHTASLILDDLPAMDNASLRRGRPCLHIAYSESTAILAATSLMNSAYEVIASLDNVSPDTRVELIRLMSNAVGANGLIGGQFHDLHEANCGERDVLIRYLKKTSALFEFSVLAGAVLIGLNNQQCAALQTVSHYLGIAFQINDDLLDGSASYEESQKDSGQDLNKMTYISIRSTDELRQDIATGRDQALAALSTVRLDDTLVEVIAEQFDRAIERAAR